MGKRTRKFTRRACHACLPIIAFLLMPIAAASAEYPRKVAITPFTSIAKEDIQQTVSVLPRLLMSRLMALAGVEVAILPTGEKPPSEQAKSAGIPLLLQGSVAKLGKGYSIDVVATEVETGKQAGAFFASASTEDEIIPQLGVLSGEIVEKLFGVKAASRVAPAAPAGSPLMPAATGSVQPPVGASPPPVPSPAISPAPLQSDRSEPRSMVKVASSDKIPDEIFRIAEGDLDRDGKRELAGMGARRIWTYKMEGDKIIPFKKLERSRDNNFLNVEMADLDGDGGAEIIVTNLVGEHIKSFVLKYIGDALEPVANDIPYYIVALEDGRGGRRLAGQGRGVSEPFYGDLFYLKWDGKTLLPDGKVPVSVSAGIFGLGAFPGDPEGRFLYIDADEHLRLVDVKGKTKYKTKEYYSGALHLFTSGQETRGNVGPDKHYIRGRIFPLPVEGGQPLFLVRQAKGSALLKDHRSFDWSRLVFIAWTGDGFSERVSTERIDNLMADFTVLGGKAGPGSRIAVPILISSPSASYSFASESVSRIDIYRMD